MAPITEAVRLALHKARFLPFKDESDPFELTLKEDAVPLLSTDSGPIYDPGWKQTTEHWQSKKKDPETTAPQKELTPSPIGILLALKDALATVSTKTTQWHSVTDYNLAAAKLQLFNPTSKMVKPEIIEETSKKIMAIIDEHFRERDQGNDPTLLTLSLDEEERRVVLDALHVTHPVDSDAYKIARYILSHKLPF